jgi:hypothetical protein
VSNYDKLPTGVLLAVSSGELREDVDTLAMFAAALRDRLAAYEPIVAGLRAMEGARYGGRLVCRIHATTIGGDLHNDQLCPWWLAQQIGGDR